MAKIKALFFDFDGTISNSKKIATNTLPIILKKEKIRFSEKKAKAMIGEKVGAAMLKLGIPKKDIPKLREKFYIEFRSQVKTLRPCVPLKPLKDFAKQYLMIVISNSDQVFIEKSAKKLKVEKLFKEIHCLEKGTTKDKKLKQLFKKYKLKPSEVIYIGDRFSDIIYAKKAKCISIAILNKCSYSSRSELKKQKPDYIIKNFSELQKLLNDKLNK